MIRGYGWRGERSETLWDEGEQTSEERELGFRFFDGRSPEARQDGYWRRMDLSFPHEQSVVQIAGRWSVDPSRLAQQFGAPGPGVLGEYARAGETTVAPT